MPATYDTGIPKPSVEEEVNEAGIRETTLQFDEPVYGAIQEALNDPRTEAVAEPLLEEGYLDAFHEGFDTVTLYTPEEEPVDGFVDAFLSIVAAHYHPPRRVELERTGRTAVYRGYLQRGGTVIDVRFQDDVSALPKIVGRDEAFHEDVSELDADVLVVTADDYDALQDGVFHLYTDISPADVDMFMDAYLDRLDEWLDAFDR